MRVPGIHLAPACLVAALLLSACGARDPLDVAGLTFAGTGGGRAGGSGGAGTGGSVPEDLCRAAVSGPKAMAGNCSTRDGRSRVQAPSAPHVTWTSKLPVDSTGQLGPSAIATDASGQAYVVATGEIGEMYAALRRVRAQDGTLDWKDPIVPDSATGTPLVLSQGGVELFAYDPKTVESVFMVDPSSGTSTSTTFGVDLYDAGGDPAVGADGSLYLAHSVNVGTSNTMTFVSRISPGGTLLWTSVDLATLGPAAAVSGEVSPGVIALADGDLVVMIDGVITKTGEVSVASAFDPATGAVRWSTMVPGELVGGPVVRADGTIAALFDRALERDLVVFDPQSGGATTTHLASSAFQIFAAARDGTLFVGADMGNGVTGVAALAGDGSTRWTFPGARDATLAADGTVIAIHPEITALDPATGATKWVLAPPTPGSCILDASLTSERGIVALQCDGTLFGASD